MIGGNHIETRCKSFKISRCERLVRIKQLATKRLQNSQGTYVQPEIRGLCGQKAYRECIL